MASTAQAVRQSVLTHVESLNMVRNTIRTAISSIAYLRNLFDEDGFEDRSVSGLELKMLRPCNSEAELILSWLEQGIFDALEKKYLRLLVFGIHNSEDQLVECYHFKFSYGESGGAAIDVSRSNDDGDSSGDTSCPPNFASTTATNLNKKTGAPKKKAKETSKEAAKQQTVQLLRSLIILTQSLSPLPDVRFVSMKLWYYDNVVPNDYEPHLFRPALPSEGLKFPDVPLECSIGRIDTGHHGVSIRVKTLADQDLQAQLEVSQGSPTASQAEIFKDGEITMSQIQDKVNNMQHDDGTDAGAAKDSKENEVSFPAPAALYDMTQEEVPATDATVLLCMEAEKLYEAAQKHTKAASQQNGGKEGTGVTAESLRKALAAETGEVQSDEVIEALIGRLVDENHLKKNGKKVGSWLPVPPPASGKLTLSKTASGVDEEMNGGKTSYVQGATSGTLLPPTSSTTRKRRRTAVA